MLLALPPVGAYRAESIEEFFDVAQNSAVGTLTADDRVAMVIGQFLNAPSLLDQFIELAATNGDYGSLISFQGLVGRNPALMELTRAS